MALIRINRNPPGSQLAVFAGLWTLFFCGWGFWFAYRNGWDTWSYGLIATGLVAPTLGLVSRSSLRLLYLAACYATLPIGWVVSHLLLGFVYYGVMTPIGLIMRLVGYDPMNRKLDLEAKSYWTKRESSEDKQRYFRQF